MWIIGVGTFTSGSFSSLGNEPLSAAYLCVRVALLARTIGIFEAFMVARVGRICIWIPTLPVCLGKSRFRPFFKIHINWHSCIRIFVTLITGAFPPVHNFFTSFPNTGFEFSTSTVH